MLHYLPYVFLTIIFISQPANALWGINYRMVIESRQADDVIKLKCYDLGGFWVTYSARVGRPITIYYLMRDHVVPYTLTCMYGYKNNFRANIVLFDGYKPDEDCRVSRGGCTFIIEDSVLYKVTRRLGKQILGDLPDTICERLWFFRYNCREKPHKHPYVGTPA